MDPQIDVLLQEQEDALRAVLSVLVQAHHEVRALRRATGWRGPAGSAYHGAVGILEARLDGAEAQLRAAVRETADAIIARECCG